MNFILSSYILFLSKTFTIFIFILLIFSIFVSRKKIKKNNLQLTNLTKNYQEQKYEMQKAKMNESEYKTWIKNYKKKQKQKIKNLKFNHEKTKTSCLFVIDFIGGINANEVDTLREEITAILSVANKNDEVLLRLESKGGVVHGYGLAASQLNRFKEKNIKLTIAIDKIAASGGYMMACVADQIVAAPFAIIGSIGVVGQIPNINRFLKKNDIDVELHTAGKHKRTLTLLGKNTEQGRNKFIQELNEIYTLFKDFVHQKRPNLDIENVSTGEHWYGIRAKEKGLIDKIKLSDDIILDNIDKKRIIKISYIQKTNFIHQCINTIQNNMINFTNLF